MGMGSKVTAQTAGYSGTPLAKKLGIKPGFNIRLINAPENYFKLFADLPEDLHINNETFEPKDLIHFFTREKGEYFSMLTGLRSQLKPGGMIWISWPKKSSKLKTDISEDVIREFALQNGLVDIKVCAVDEVWSGLKLVIPVKDRI